MNNNKIIVLNELNACTKLTLEIPDGNLSNPIQPFFPPYNPEYI